MYYDNTINNVDIIIIIIIILGDLNSRISIRAFALIVHLAIMIDAVDVPLIFYSVQSLYDVGILNGSLKAQCPLTRESD